jgi:hypothetical protein
MPKGHEKETSKTNWQPSSSQSSDSKSLSNVLVVLDNQSLKTNPFGANVTGENSYRRAERITAALHLVTNHVPESEPVRLALRAGGLTLLSAILDLRSGFRAVASEKGQAVLAQVRELVSMVRLLAVSGYVSTQNAHAIAEALDELGNLIVVAQRSTLAEQTTISREDLMPPVSHPTFSENAARPDIRRKTVQKDMKDRTTKDRETDAARPERIMDILKAGGVLGIKDIASNLPQYSEKMIQRELAELVQLRRVEKTGEKRWSRYKVAT